MYYLSIFQEPCKASVLKKQLVAFLWAQFRHIHSEGCLVQLLLVLTTSKGPYGSHRAYPRAPFVVVDGVTY